MEPWDGPGVDRVHRRHGDRRGARPQRPAPVALLGHRRRPRDHGERGRRARRRSARAHRAEGPARAGEDLPRRHDAGPHHPRRRDQGRARGRSSRTRSGSTPGSCTSTTCRRSSRSCRSTARRCSSSACSATPQEDLRLIIAPMARNAVESLGSMGTDTPVPVHLRPAAHALRVLQAAVRAGHEPAARRQLRGARHVAQLRRSGPRATCSTPTPTSCRQIVCPYADPHQRGAREAALHRRRRDRGARLHAVHRLLPLPGRRGRRRAAHGDRQRAHAGERGDRRRRQPHHPLRPLRRRRERADPRAAHHRRRAPPPRAREDAHARRARRRDRRGARGAPLRAAARVRRGRDQPVPRVRHDPRPVPRGRARRGSPSARRSRTT